MARERASAAALKREAEQLKAAHEAASLEHRAQLREVQVKQQGWVGGWVGGASPSPRPP